MKKLSLILILAIILATSGFAPLSSNAAAEADVLSVSVVFDEPASEKVDSFDLITIEGCGLTTKFGDPMLPVKMVLILLPPDRDVVDAEIVPKEPEAIGVYDIAPSEEPAHTGKSGISESNPTPGYSPGEYPVGAPGRLLGQAELRGYKLAEVRVFPVSYESETGEATFYRRMDVDLVLAPSPSTASVVPSAETDEWVREHVANPDVMMSYESGPKLQTVWDYLIITRQMFYDQALALKAHKQSFGYKVGIKLVYTIDADYTGYDIAEKIRNCIERFYRLYSTRWVLLMGDVDPADIPSNIDYVPPAADYDQPWEVPTRYLFTSDEVGGVVEDYWTPSDYYYAGLTGDWDADGDHKFGEVGEEDWYAEVYVGRLTATSASEMQTQVNKIIAYKPGVVNFLLLGAESDAFTDEKQLKQFVITNFVDTYFTTPDPTVNTYERYESDGTLTEANVISDINDYQPTIINSASHGGETALVQGTMVPFIDTGTCANIENKPYLWYADACLAGAFDYSGGNCLSEAMVKDPNGGAIAWVGATRTSWYWKAYPDHLYRLNGMQDWQFWEQFLANGDHQPGSCLYNAKMNYLMSGPDMTLGYEKKNMFAYQLIGDPQIYIVSPPEMEWLRAWNMNTKVQLDPGGHVPPGQTVRIYSKVTDINNERMDEARVLFDETHGELFTLSGEGSLQADTAGMGEPKPQQGKYSKFKSYLEAQGYKVHKLTSGPITFYKLTGYDVLVLACPQSSFTASEIDAIKKFVEHGGGLLIIGDWGSYGTVPDTVSDQFGISIDQNVVYDDTDNFGGMKSWVIYQSDNFVHPISQGLSSHRTAAGSSLTGGTTVVKADADAYDGGSLANKPVIACVEYADGRVVVTGDGSCFLDDPTADGYGIDFADNKELAIRIVKWLELKVRLWHRHQATASWITHEPSYSMSNKYWYYDWTIPTSATLGLYDTCSGATDTTSSWHEGEYQYWVEYGEFEVVGAPPSIVWIRAWDIDRKIQLDPRGQVPRGHTVRLYTKVSDLEDPPNTLSVQMWYRPSGEMSWIGAPLTYSVAYKYWYYDWTIPTGAVLDFYEVKVDVTDTSGLSDQRVEIEEFEVVSGHPTVVWTRAWNMDTKVRLDPGGTIPRGDTVRMYARVRDSEDAPKDLDVKIYYRPQGHSWIEATPTYQTTYDYWYYDWTIPGTATLGLHDIKVVVTDSDLFTGTKTEYGEYEVT